MQLEAKRSCTLAVGVSGSGKSTFALRLLVADTSFKCRFLFDPEGEFALRLNLVAAETIEELHCSVDDGFVIYDPHTMFPGNMAGAFAWFCDWVFKVCSSMPGTKILLVDEVWKYCSPGSIPMPLAECIQTGRKRGLTMLFCTQRPNRLNEAITNEVTELVCFRLQGGNALKRVEELGADADEVHSLKPGQFVAIGCDFGTEMRGSLW